MTKPGKKDMASILEMLRATSFISSLFALDTLTPAAADKLISVGKARASTFFIDGPNVDAA